MVDIVDPFESTTKPDLSGIVDPFDKSTKIKETPASQIGDQLTRAATDIPSEIGNEASAGWERAGNAKISKIPFIGPAVTPIETAKGLSGIAQAVASPIVGTAKSVIGHGLTAAGIAGGEYLINPIVEALGGKPQHPDPERIYGKAKEAVDEGLMTLPAGKVSPRPIPPPIPVQEPFGVTRTLGETSGDLATRQFEQGALRNQHGAPAQRQADQFFNQQRPEQLAAAKEDVLRQLDPSGNQVIAENPAEAANLAQQSLQTEAARTKAQVTAAYTRAKNLGGEIHTDAFVDMPQNIKTDLSNRPDAVIIDNNTPVASRMIDYLDGQIGRLDITNKAQPQGVGLVAPGPALKVGVNLEGVEQWRKNLSRMRGDALAAYGNNPSDYRAASAIIDAFDARINQAVNGGQFTGSRDAVDAWNAARDMHAQRMRTWGNDQVGRQLQKIIGNPQQAKDPASLNDVANVLYSSSGTSPNSNNIALAKRVKAILGEDSPEWAAIRQGMIHRLISVAEGSNERGVGTIATRLHEFLGGRGSDMAEVMLTPAQRSMLRSYADLHRQLQVPQTAANWPNTAGGIVPHVKEVGRKIMGAIGAVIGHHIGPPIIGEVAGYGIGKAAGAIGNRNGNAQAARRAIQQMPLVGQRFNIWQRAVAQARLKANVATTNRLTLATTNLVNVLNKVGIDRASALRILQAGPDNNNPANAQERASGGAVKDYEDGGVPTDDNPYTSSGLKKVYINGASDLAEQAGADLKNQPGRLPAPTDNKAIDASMLPEAPDIYSNALKALAAPESFSPGSEKLEENLRNQRLEKNKQEMPDVGEPPIGDGGQFSKGTKEGNRLFGTGQEERMQTWPENMVRSGVALPHDVYTGEEPMYVTDPATGEQVISPNVILRAQDMAGMAGSGGLGGVGNEAGAAFGTSPFLRPALKHEGKIYKAPPNGEHLDAIPPALRDEFHKQAMSGQDISNFDFDFMNHKGQFLNREDALKYGIDNGLVSPHEARQGALTSPVLRSETDKPAAALSALEKPFEVLQAKKNNVQMSNASEVLKNPPQREFTNLAKEVGELRSLVDKDGNLYVWDAHNGTHEGVSNSLGIVPDWGAGAPTWNTFKNKLFLNGSVEGYPNWIKSIGEKATDRAGGFTLLRSETDKPAAALSAAENSVPKNVDWKNIDSVERTLSPQAAKALNNWVGGDVDTLTNVKTGNHPGWGIFDRKAMSGPVVDEISASFQPLRDQLKRDHGDSVTLYRFSKGAPEGTKAHDLLSFTSDKNVAEGLSGAPQEKPLVPESTIAAKEAEFEKNGRVDVGPNTWLEKKTETFDPAAWGQPGQPKEITYTAIMRPDGMVTDTDSVRSYLESENAYRKEYYNDIRDKKLANVKQYQIHVDDIVAATDRFGQKEFIVKNTKNLYSDSSQAGAPLSALEHAQPFYSAVEQTVQGAKQTKMHGEQWANWLKNQLGVKPDELQYTGLDKWLREQKGPVTKEQVADFIDKNKVQVNDVVKGGISTSFEDLPKNKIRDLLHDYAETNDIPNKQVFKDYEDGRNWGQLQEHYDSMREAYPDEYKEHTKYQSYQLPGGNNYREHLLTLSNKGASMQEIKNLAKTYFNESKFKLERPELKWEDALDYVKNAHIQQAQEKLDRDSVRNNYKSSHWDEPNVLAHVRTNDRDVGGKPSLHLEELQSDWHGSALKHAKQAAKNDGKEWKDLTAVEKEVYNKNSYRDPNLPTNPRSGLVPDAPFKNNGWAELAMKRMIQKAASEGTERISWTPGEAQAARYDLSKQIDEIRAYRMGSKYGVSATDKNGKSHDFGVKSPEELPEVLGKDLADKIINNKEHKQTYSGLDLKIGGEGMKGFYDQMLPKMVEKLGKQYGVKVKQGSLPGPLSNKIGEPPKDHKVFYFDIPQKMKEDVLKKGFPLFSDTAHGGLLNQNAKKDKDKIEGPTQEEETENKVDQHLKARAAGGRVLASNINSNPSEAQKAAGNYLKDHVNLFGLNLTIENAKGSIRSGKDAKGVEWKSKLPEHYGYICGSVGADSDHLDVYLGPHIKSDKVFVINQIDKDTKRFDETKSLLGFGSLQQALNCYTKAFSDGKGLDRIGSIVPCSIKQFKEWVKSDNHHKPFVLPK